MKYKAWDNYGPKAVTANQIYPWHKWLNGSMWLLIQGEDFHGTTKNFRKYLFSYCWEHGIKVKTKQAENRRDLYIKAVGRTTRDGIRRRQHFRALERRWEELQSGEKDQWSRRYSEDLDSREV